MKSFWHFLDDRVNGRENFTSWFVGNKLSLNKWLIDNGFPTSNIYKIVNTSDIEQLFILEEDKFCIKTNVGHSGQCVFPVLKINDTTFFDILRHNLITKDYIKSQFIEFYNTTRWKGSCKFFTEQLFLTKDNRIAADYKFYTFRNKIGLILRIDRNSDRIFFTIYDDELNIMDIRHIMHNDFITDKHFEYAYASPDKNILEFKDIAFKIINILNTNFVSIDTYYTKHGMFICEITPAPGGPYYKKYMHFSDDFDLYLGSLL